MNTFEEIPAGNISIAKRTLKYGVGINDAQYQVQLRNTDNTLLTCPFYKVWSDMLKRCYSQTFLTKNPTYKGCYVCTPWLTFSNFRKWMETQAWKGKELDKDILIAGNKIYSPETCIYVPQWLNSFTINNIILIIIYS